MATGWDTRRNKNQASEARQAATGASRVYEEDAPIGDPPSPAAAHANGAVTHLLTIVLQEPEIPENRQGTLANRPSAPYAEKQT